MPAANQGCRETTRGLPREHRQRIQQAYTILDRTRVRDRTANDSRGCLQRMHRGDHEESTIPSGYPCLKSY